MQSWMNISLRMNANLDDEYLAKKLDLDVEKIKEVRTAHAISYTLPIDEQIELYNEDNTLEKIEKEELLEKNSRSAR